MNFKPEVCSKFYQKYCQECQRTTCDNSQREISECIVRLISLNLTENNKKE